MEFPHSIEAIVEWACDAAERLEPGQLGFDGLVEVVREFDPERTSLEFAHALAVLLLREPLLRRYFDPARDESSPVIDRARVVRRSTEHLAALVAAGVQAEDLQLDLEHAPAGIADRLASPEGIVAGALGEVAAWHLAAQQLCSLLLKEARRAGTTEELLAVVREAALRVAIEPEPGDQ
jgi:hypothetical protein